MSNPVLETLKLVKDQIAELEDALLQKKRVANDLCELAGQAPMYSDLESVATSGTIRADEFYGRPLATVVREVLLRKGHAVRVPEIYDALVEGGFQFDAKNKDYATRGLRVSLSKNTSTFHKLPNGTYGLTDWYPNVKASRNGNGSDKEKPDIEEDLPSEDFGESQEDDKEKVEAAQAVKG